MEVCGKYQAWPVERRALLGSVMLAAIYLPSNARRSVRWLAGQASRLSSFFGDKHRLDRRDACPTTQLCFLLAALLFIFSSHFAAAASNSEWSVRVWQSDDGLPNNNVTGLAQTDDGYLWVATSGHFARFDGAKFEEFTAKNVLAAAGGYAARVSSLLSDSKGGLWLSMFHGPLVYLNRGRASIFTNDLPDFTAQNMVEAGDGAVWITYHGNAVCRVKDGHVTRFTEADGLPARFDGALAVDRSGRVWFAKDGQLGIFKNEHFVTLAKNLDSTLRLAGARDGGLWFCSGHELFRCDDAGKIQSCGRFKAGVTDSDPTALLEDQNGAVWIGTADGLFRYNGLAFEPIPVSQPFISSLLLDREGNLWAGTGGGGLNRIQPRAFTLENETTGLSAGAVQSICEATNHAIWVVTQNGALASRTNGNWHTVSGETNWPGGKAICVTADRDGNVWIGTQNHALYFWRDGQFTALRPADGFAGHVVRGLLAATNGDLWIVENDPDSVQCLHAGKMQTFNLFAGSGEPRALIQDAAKNIWIGTSKGCLIRIRDGIISDETTNVSGYSASIRSLAATPDGSLWIGYASWGVGRFKDGHFAKIANANGLFNDYISEIVPDGHGWIWFGSDRGIFKVKQAELDAVAEGRAARVSSIHYGRGEGLPSLQANFGASPNVLCSRDDRLWFPMRTALAVVNLRNLRENSAPPPVWLKQVLVDDKIIATYGGVMPVQAVAELGGGGKNLSLPPNYRRLEFDFAALSFSTPENVRLQYRLTDFDDDWVDAGTLHSATYSRLAAGNYQFQVRARNGGGSWRESEKLALTVTPFFWQRGWFRCVLLAAFTLVVIAVVRYVSFRRLHLKLRAMEQQAALDKERSRIAKDIHDDLGGSLTQIKLLFELTQKRRADPDKVDLLGQEGLAATRQIIKSMDEIVWAVNPGNDSLPQLVDYIGQFAIEFLARADIRCRVDLPDRPVAWVISPEVRHNLFLVVKEALNNVIRHAGANEVWLRITVTETILTIILEDNGHGFEADRTKESGNGLLNMQRRMSEIGGQSSLESKTGGGTRVAFTLPKPSQT